MRKTNQEAFVDPEVKRRDIDHYVLAYVDADGNPLNRMVRVHSASRI
ncbi:MAG: hypothetical protein ABW076_10760 [Candidatus Thiodiazotropha sp.]